jgi:hypothetical protein
MASDSAEVRWSGGPQPERVSIQGHARIVDSVAEADGVGDIRHDD